MALASCHTTLAAFPEFTSLLVTHFVSWKLKTAGLFGILPTP
jgi:hypothetical protein